jgi:tripartite-type tricarboxylate transporter receptor subunit TctC
MNGAQAQTHYPVKPIKIVVPFGAGGVADLTARAAVQKLSESLSDLIEFGRAHPGKLNIGTINVGSTQHLAAELLRSLGNLLAQVIPYNGTPAVLNALRGGQIDAAVEILGPLKSHITAKAVRLLGVMGESRPKDMPQVLTVREMPGLSQFNVSPWNALGCPPQKPLRSSWIA